jgi:hypothetical protein
MGIARYFESGGTVDGRPSKSMITIDKHLLRKYGPRRNGLNVI